MNTIVYLIRHGDYENPKQVFHGRLPGFPLSEKGKQQVKKLSKYLEREPLDCIYSSPLIRARETAGIIATKHRLPVIFDMRLIDIKTPAEGKPLSFMNVRDWNFYRPDLIKLGGESLDQIYLRMDSFFQKVLTEYGGKQILIVSHADSIMTITVKFAHKKLTLKNIRTDYVQQACGYKIECDEEGKCLSFADYP